MKCAWMTFPEIGLAHDRQIEVSKNMNEFSNELSEIYLDEFSKKCK